MRRYSFVVVAWLLAPCAAFGVPSAVPYAGYLAHEDGTPFEGTVSLTVAAYGQAEGGEPVWGPVHFEGVEVRGGVLSFVLGDTGSPLDSSLLGGGGLWLEIAVDGTVMTPRQRVLSAPYALRSGDSERLGGTLASDYATKAGMTQALAGYALTKDLKPVCFTGKYEDLVGTPDLSVFVQVGDLADYATKASLSAVAFSGRYEDLLDRPDLSVFVLLDQVAGVALTGEYGDLKGKPDLTVFLRADGSVALAGDLDAARHRLVNVAIDASVAAPASPVAGQLWWDGGTKTLKVYDGVAWRGLGTGPGTLPPDGLEAISNKTMTNVLAGDYVAFGLPVGIGSARDVPVTVPDAGTLRGITVWFSLTHPSVAEVEVRLFPPGDTVGLRLVKAGSVSGSSLDQVILAGDPLPDGGTLGALFGREQSGTWVLRVTDTIPNGNEGTGTVTAFWIQTEYLASAQVAILGDVAVSGGQTVGGDQSVVGDQTVLGTVSASAVVVAGQDVASELASLRAELWCLKNCDPMKIGDCKDRTCDGATQTCTPGPALPDGTPCAGGLYRCKSGQCCVPNHHKECVGSDLYWYDSCGVPGDLVEKCPFGCEAGSCKPAPFACPSGYRAIPAGTFTMGSPSTEPGRGSDEVQHPVTISKGFCLKETEVTQGEWQAVMGNNPSSFSSCGPSCPVEQVSWWDAVAYCNQLSSNEGLPPCYTLTGCSGTPGAGNYSCTGVTFVGLSCTGYRLPTESEWEYAARAGTNTGTYNGTSSTTACESPNPVLDPIAWFCGNSGNTTHPVKGKQPNAFGLYDMLGNVWEWVWDWYGTYPGTVTDPTGPTTGSGRVERSGGWHSTADDARAANRNNLLPGNRYDDLGFRPARSSP